MDAKASCLLKGLAGVVFGGLALVAPQQVLAFFDGIFWILLITVMVVSILIAITSPAEESLFWFLVSAALLVIGIVEMLFPQSISFIFVLAVAGLAFYAGYTGISCAMNHKQSKYLLVAGVIVSSIILLFIFLTYVPAMRLFVIMTIVGTISFVLGMFAILMGIALKEGDEIAISPRVFIMNSCRLPTKSPDLAEDKNIR